jgi:surface protein
MFSTCNEFNQPLNGWNVSNVNEMYYMFFDCYKFNQPLNDWNVSNVTDMTGMFENCRNFNQPLTNWTVSNAETHNMFNKCPISEENKPLSMQRIRQQPQSQVGQQVWTTPLNNSTTQINPSTEIGSDLINMERDINVLNFMNEDPKNIAFYFNNQIYLTNKDSLQYSITDPQNKGKNIKYECLTVNSMSQSNIVFDAPYYSMRAIGSYGLVSLKQINEIIQNESIRYVEMTTEPIKQLVSTASLQATGPNPSYVGASHCQEGQGENVYNLLNITNISTTGGRKRKYTKKRKHKRTKKRNNKKHYKNHYKKHYKTYKK